MDKQRLQSLLFLRMQGSLGETDRQELEQFLETSPAVKRMIESLEDETSFKEKLHYFLSIPEKPWSSGILNNSKNRTYSIWFRSAAAILIAITGVVLYFYFSGKHSPATEIAHTVSNNIPPGSTKAILTLSNGQKVELNQASSETIHDGKLSIRNKDGQLSYFGHQNLSDKSATVNTMTTPKGGQYQLTLADGTQVWLNAASSITYPTIFKGKTREVRITGEAYFEVTQNKEKPFIVKAEDPFSSLEKEDGAEREEISIRVLGTSFNVNSYTDEPTAKISLVEGSVSVNQQVVRPGESYQHGKINRTDIAQDIAWKNGAFNFNNLDLQTVMRQLSRWYDIGIRFEGKVSGKKLGGKIGRDLNLSQMLETLEDLGVHTKLEGNTLVVLSQ